MTESCEKASTNPMLSAVFAISLAAIGWQLGLMRCLLISRYHHFSFLIISCALLGFGAGGTVLSLAKVWVGDHRDKFFQWGTLGFAFSMPICFRLGEALPVNVYFAPDDLHFVLGWWFLFWILHCIPFLIAGILIGLALMTSGTRSHVVYASSLLGSAAGALGGILLLERLPANGISVPLSLCVIASCFPMIAHQGSHLRRSYCAVLVGSAVILSASFFTNTDRIFPLNIDQYKALAYVQRLVQQGSAENKITLHGLRGRVDLFAGPHFHALLSLNSKVPPPPLDIILRDGFQVGSIPSISSLSQARFLEGTLFSFPYKLLKPKRVLILGEAGSVYLWLARLSQADLIVLVQPDRNILNVLENHHSKVLEDPRILVEFKEPRAFLDTTDMTFDIIHLAGLEGFSPGSSGIGGLREDYLATVEGFGRCLDILSPTGMACVVRGIQEPARDNIKIPATWIEALEKRKVDDPSNQILMARDELACATLAAKSPFGHEAVETFRQTCRDMSWDTEWFPGIRPEDTNRIHVLPGPEGSSVSWYHYAMEELFSSRREDFYRSWVCHIRPASDDRPFFHDFFRTASFSQLSEAFGPLWLARSEMGFLLLIISAVWTAVTASVMLPGPIVLLKRSKTSPSLSLIIWMVVFFAAIGTGFMLLEMNFIQMFTRFLGDPISAAALVLGGFLFFAGLGSMAQPLLTDRLPGGITAVTLAAVLIIFLDAAVLPGVFEIGAGFSPLGKIFLGLGFMAPLAFVMGVPFPWGLSVLQKKSVDSIPVAWAVNGFASVVSSSVAVIFVMAYGFKNLSALAAGVYCLSGLFSWGFGFSGKIPAKQEQADNVSPD